MCSWIGTPFTEADVSNGTCVECGPYRWRRSGKYVHPANCKHRDRYDHQLLKAKYEQQMKELAVRAIANRQPKFSGKMNGGICFVIGRSVKEIVANVSTAITVVDVVPAQTPISAGSTKPTPAVRTIWKIGTGYQTDI